MHPDVLDIDATADLLAMSKRSVYGIVRAGDVPAWRLGQQWRLWRPAVLRAVGGPEVEVSNPLHPEDDPGVVTTKTLAELLNITPATCRALLKDGSIPSRRVGHSTRIWWPNVRQLMIDGTPVAERGDGSH